MIIGYWILDLSEIIFLKIIGYTLAMCVLCIIFRCSIYTRQAFKRKDNKLTSYVCQRCWRSRPEISNNCNPCPNLVLYVDWLFISGVVIISKNSGSVTAAVWSHCPAWPNTARQASWPAEAEHNVSSVSAQCQSVTQERPRTSHSSHLTHHILIIRHYIIITTHHTRQNNKHCR